MDDNRRDPSPSTDEKAQMMEALAEEVMDDYTMGQITVEQRNGLLALLWPGDST